MDIWKTITALENWKNGYGEEQLLACRYALIKFLRKLPKIPLEYEWRGEIREVNHPDEWGFV